MAKKKGPSKKRKPTPEGVDPNEKRRERLEARRRAKAEAIAAKQRAEARARIVRLIAYAALFGLAVWFFFLRDTSGVPEALADRVETFSGQGEGDHAAEGEVVTYETSPPVAGRHAPGSAPCGTYAVPVPSETLVHSLEHGAVYLLFSPSLPAEQIEALQEIAAGYDENVLSAPYEGEMAAPIAVGSWGERMDLETLDRDAIQTYLDAFAGEGPESQSQTCENDVDDTFEPEEETTPAPGGEETPAPGDEETPGSTPAPKESSDKK